MIMKAGEQNLMSTILETVQVKYLSPRNGPAVSTWTWVVGSIVAYGVMAVLFLHWGLE